MEIQEITTVVILDLLAVFDTVDHDVFLTVLKTCFGIDGKVINVLKTISGPGTLNYLSKVTPHPQKS